MSEPGYGDSRCDGRIFAKAGVLDVRPPYDAGVVDEMEGVPLECRTRLTSREPSSFHRSTLRTNIPCSIELCRGALSVLGAFFFFFLKERE